MSLNAADIGNVSNTFVFSTAMILIEWHPFGEPCALTHEQKVREAMLRITTEAASEQTVLRVEGKLVPPWVEELEKSWRQRVESAKTLVIDLRAVTFVGTEGRQLLERIYRSGAKLVASGITMNAMLEEMETRCNGKGK